MSKRKKTGKTTPVPTRFDPPENDELERLHLRTGLPKSEIIRRSVRLLATRVAEEDNVGFILDELAPKPGTVRYSKSRKK